MLAQTYVYDHGVLYSRYAPGFPIVLAAWIALFGPDAAHGLNPVLFLAVLLVLVGIEWSLRRSLWSGTCAAALVLLCPTLVLWALTATRDLSAHFFGISGPRVARRRGSTPGGGSRRAARATPGRSVRRRASPGAGVLAAAGGSGARLATLGARQPRRTWRRAGLAPSSSSTASPPATR
jgi:hypothetical protein